MVLGSLARWVGEIHDKTTLARVCGAAGLSPEDLDGRNHWGSIEQFERLLLEVRSLCANDAEFSSACTHRIAEQGFGPMGLVLWATSPRTVFKTAIRTVRHVSTISRYEILEDEPTLLRLRYTSTKKESRLMCLSRQAQGSALPTLWRLPPAHFTEGSCIGHGDRACEYVVRMFERRRFLPTLMSGALAGGAGFAGQVAGIGAPPSWVLLAASGALLGYTLELMRTNRLNLRVGQAIHGALRQLAEEDAEARREILELTQRQHEWTRVLENEVAERTDQLAGMVDGIRSLQQQRVVALRAATRDLRNPLTAIEANAEFLRARAATLHKGKAEAAELAEIGDELIQEARTMNGMLEELIDAGSSDAGPVRLRPERIDVSPLADRLERRLKAFVRGRDVRPSVITTREAPAAIEADRLLLDRVVDNLLINAAKHTERGSIVVELGGKPGFLSIEVSDTGAGIESARLDSIEVSGAGDAPPRSRGWGLGLEVVVELLRHAGGSLEVVSKPGLGTTFWAYFPERAPRRIVAVPSNDGDAPAPRDVVRVRRK